MKFLVKELRETVERTIKERIDGVARYNRAQADTAELKAAEWVADNSGHWLGFADIIVNRIEGGFPVTVEAAPSEVRDSWGRVTFFNDKKPQPRVPDIEQLRALKEVLAACAEETISTTTLRDMGFRNLSELFRTTAKAAA